MSKLEDLQSDADLACRNYLNCTYANKVSTYQDYMYAVNRVNDAERELHYTKLINTNNKETNQ